MSNFKNLFETPHPIYTQYCEYWKFLLNSYEGGVDYSESRIKNETPQRTDSLEFTLMAGGEKIRSKFTGNLFPHPKERNQDFNSRKDMSYYYNFCSPIIDIYTNHLFKLPIISDYGSIEKSVDYRNDNIDLMNSSVDEFRKEISELSQIFGHTFVLVDSPQIETPILTLKDKMDNGVFPFFTIFNPMDVINWAVDGFGNPYWVLLREKMDMNIDPFSYDPKKRDINRFRLWTRDEWILMDSEGEEIGRGNHGLGVVPLVPAYEKRSKKARSFLGISFLADLAFIARDIYNSCSELRQILRDQTFSFLILQGDAGDYSEIEVATNKGLRYPKETNAPAFISPDASNAEVYFKHIDRQVEKMFELAMLPAGSASFEGQGAVQQSGVSKAWDFNQTNSALSKKAINLEDAEYKMWDMFAKWEGTEFDGSIQYPREFNVQDLVADLNEAKELLKLGLGDMFNTEIKRGIVKKKFPQKDDNEIEAMVAEFKDVAEESQGNTLRTRFGSLFNRNATLGGQKKEEGSNV